MSGFARCEQTLFNYVVLRPFLGDPMSLYGCIWKIECRRGSTFAARCGIRSESWNSSGFVAFGMRPSWGFDLFAGLELLIA